MTKHSSPAHPPTHFGFVCANANSGFGGSVANSGFGAAAIQVG